MENFTHFLHYVHITHDSFLSDAIIVLGNEGVGLGPPPLEHDAAHAPQHHRSANCNEDDHRET